MPATQAVPGLRRAEARCRYYTREEARRLGWDIRHPAAGGQFLEEQEISDYFPALRAALGHDRPDFVVLTGPRTVGAVIECKNDFSALPAAIHEARQYADTINQVSGFDVRLAIGIAGTPDRMVQTRSVFHSHGWIRLTSHEYELTQLPSPLELDTALRNANGTTDVQLPDGREFFDAAIQISRILRLAKVEEAVRPKVLGAIILAMYQGVVSLDPETALESVNANVHAAVARFTDVAAERRTFLEQTLTLSVEAHNMRPAIEQVVYQLERLNVRSIVRSGVDFLGQFYENFLRYGCDNNKLGIVFTPRHITRFCADLLGVDVGMKVYDPASGTGGFLVAAFDRMMEHATTPRARELVRNSLHGNDTNPTVWSLAMLNMFFRGDGKSRIEFRSCFDDSERLAGQFDRVMLNPPYSQDGEPETDFIDHALNSLKPGGELAVVVKASVLVDANLAPWRSALVASHHILGAISLPVDLFYPTAVPTIILLVRAHTPDNEASTFLAQVQNDGYEINKNRRVPVDGSQLHQMLDLYAAHKTGAFVRALPNVACTVQRQALVDGAEICAERWLPSRKFDRVTYDNGKRYAIRQMSLAVANYPEIVDELIDDYEWQLQAVTAAGRAPGARGRLSVWFNVTFGASGGMKNYPAGAIPYVSSGNSYNSIVGFVEVPDDETYDCPCITVTAFGQACIHPWRFCARGNGGSAVRVLIPRFPMSVATLLWFVAQINAQRWRFHYGRMATGPRLKLLQVDPPPQNLQPVDALGQRLQRLRPHLDALWQDTDISVPPGAPVTTDRGLQWAALMQNWEENPLSHDESRVMDTAIAELGSERVAIDEPAE